MARIKRTRIKIRGRIRTRTRIKIKIRTRIRKRMRVKKWRSKGVYMDSSWNQCTRLISLTVL